MLKKKPAIVAGAAVVAFALGISSASAEGLVKYEIKDEAIAKSLTGKPGDPLAGRKTAASRKKGNCLACHAITDLKELPYHGEIAPTLDGVADRLTEGEMRLRVVNPKAINEDTSMPSFYRTEGLHRVLKNFKGKTVLSAQEVEDVVAYLMTMKEK